MFRSATISSCAFIAFFSVICTAQYENNLLHNKGLRANVHDSKQPSLQCYDCNSLFDPRCGDPFDPYTIALVNCSDRLTPEHIKYYFGTPYEVRPTICRKVKQKVEGHKVRVLRFCGYIPDDHDDKECYKRQGTAGVEMTYCSCTNSQCNTGHSLHCPFSSIATLIVAITIAINCLGRESN